jgi:Uma2 family endonuclease
MDRAGTERALTLPVQEYADDLQIEHQPIRGLKRVEYERLAELGVFGDERIELVFGTIVAMTPIDPAHVESTVRVHELLFRQLGGRARVICRAPFAASDDSEPEPDVYVTPLRDDAWTHHPTRAYLVVEVARSSLAYDRSEKVFLYGISEVDEYWIVDQVHGVIEVRRDRDAGTWRSIETFRRGDTVAMRAFPDVSVAVADVLPPA